MLYDSVQAYVSAFFFITPHPQQAKFRVFWKQHQMGDNHKNRVVSCRNLFLKNHWTRKVELYIKTF